jgi:hypothetical protein
VYSALHDIVVKTLLIASAAVALTLVARSSSSGQLRDAASLQRYLTFEEPNQFACLLTWFPPVLIQNGIALKKFVRSKTFRSIREEFGDLRAVDAIYIRSMQLTNNNTAIALLLATLATFDHEMVGVRNPVFRLYFPLTDESREEFRRRIRNLPRKLYADTPPIEMGDRDKLQHFFGSAFLAYISESRDAADRFGTFVERGEDVFVLGGVNDDRDFRANRHGQQFAAALLENNRRVPSEFMLFQIVEAGRDSARYVPQCAGVF